MSQPLDAFTIICNMYTVYLRVYIYIFIFHIFSYFVSYFIMELHRDSSISIACDELVEVVHKASLAWPRVPRSPSFLLRLGDLPRFSWGNPITVARNFMD